MDVRLWLMSGSELFVGDDCKKRCADLELEPEPRLDVLRAESGPLPGDPRGRVNTQCHPLHDRRWWQSVCRFDGKSPMHLPVSREAGKVALDPSFELGTRLARTSIVGANSWPGA